MRTEQRPKKLIFLPVAVAALLISACDKKSEVDEIGDKIENAGNAVKEAIKDANDSRSAEKLRDAAEDLGDEAEEALDTAKELGREAVDETGDVLRKTGEKFEEAADDLKDKAEDS